MLQLPYVKYLSALKKRDAALYRQIITIHPGGGIITEATQNILKIKILLTAITFKPAATTHELLVYQNINSEVEATKLKVWNSLLNVMTHKIMNSVTPISSLSDALMHHMQQPETQQSALGKDISTSVETIKRRSDGLPRFVKIYRNLNAIQHLKTEHIDVKNMLEHIDVLMRPTLHTKNYSSGYPSIGRI